MPVSLSLTAALLVVIYLYPILSTQQWYVSHTKGCYLYVMEMFRDAVAHGIRYPRWLPGLQGGYGYPIFLFTAPGLFFLTLPFTYVFSNIVFAFYASLILLTTFGAFGAYKLARLYCPPAASIGCMLLFFTMPYLATNLFVRGDITEYGAMMLCLWALYFLIRLTDGIESRSLSTGTIAGFTASLAALTLMHPLVFLYCAIAGSLLLIGKWEENAYGLKTLLVPVYCALLALTFSCPYWITAIQMKPFINQGGVFMLAGAKTPRELFSGFFNPGLWQTALALLGWLCARRSVFMRYAFGAQLLLLFLLTDYAQLIWYLDTPLRYSQFPWRVNSVLAVLQLLGIIQLAAWLSARIKNTAVWIALPACVLFLTLFSVDNTGVRYNEQHRIWGPLDYAAHKAEWERKEFIYAGVYREFFPATARYDGLPNRLHTHGPMAQPLHSDTDRLIMAPDSSDYLIHFTVTTASPSGVLINQMAFPGWEITINGSRAPFDTEAEHGRIAIPLATPGSYEIKAWYDGPPGWQQRDVMMALAILCLAILLYRERRIINIE